MRMKKSLSDVYIRQNNQEWIDARNQGKLVRREETDAIKTFTEYCVLAGSKNANRYYISLAKMEYKALFLLEQRFEKIKDLLTGQQFMVLMTADQVVTKSLIDGMNSKMEYHEIFKMAKERVEIFASVLPKTPVVMLDEIKRLKEA